MTKEPYSQKYTLVHFIHQVEVGFQFPMSDWPLHITLADVFAIDRDATDIDSKLATLVAGKRSITLRATAQGLLGETPVVLLEENTALLNLHHDIVDLLEANGARFNSPEFTRDGFVGHSTIQKSGKLELGQPVHIDSLALVDMFPGGDWQQRKVLRSFKLAT